MTGTDQRSSGPFGDLIRTFHDVRRAASRTSDPDLLPPFNSADVRWSEPGVGSHMVVLEGRGAVEAVLRLRARVAARGGDYRNRFGVVPSFRAALRAGPVVVGEMGDSKLEIVLLGLPHRGGRELWAPQSRLARPQLSRRAEGRSWSSDQLRVHSRESGSRLRC